MSLHGDLIFHLEEAGCHKVRNGGNHDVWFSPIKKRSFPVPNKSHLHDRHLANRVLKQAGLPKAF